jgi:hypothetical protein
MHSYYQSQHLRKLTVLSLRKKDDCTSGPCIFNWNTPVTGHVQRTVDFPERKPLPRSTAKSSVIIGRTRYGRIDSHDEALRWGSDLTPCRFVDMYQRLRRKAGYGSRRPCRNAQPPTKLHGVVPEHHNLKLMSDRFDPSLARLCRGVPNNETENVRTKFHCSAFA